MFVNMLEQNIRTERELFSLLAEMVATPVIYVYCMSMCTFDMGSV